MKTLSTIVVLFLLAGTSCRSARTLGSTSEHQKENIVVVKDSIVYKDTVITLQGDSVIITDTIPCPEVTYAVVAHSNSGRTTATASIKNNRLLVDCKTDSLQQVIKGWEKYVSARNTSREVLKETIAVQDPVQTRKIRKQRWQIIGLISLHMLIIVALALGFFYRFIKISLPFKF